MDCIPPKGRSGFRLHPLNYFRWLIRRLIDRFCNGDYRWWKSNWFPALIYIIYVPRPVSAKVRRPHNAWRTSPMMSLTLHNHEVQSRRKSTKMWRHRECEQVLTSASWLCSTPCPITQTYSDSFSYQVQSCVAGVHGYSAHVVCFRIDSHTAISRNTEVSWTDAFCNKALHATACLSLK